MNPLIEGFYPLTEKLRETSLQSYGTSAKRCTVLTISQIHLFRATVPDKNDAA